MITAQQAWAAADKAEAAFKLAEIDALEAQYAASIAEARARHEERYGDPMQAMILDNSAEQAALRVRELEDLAQGKYEEWADMVR